MFERLLKYFHKDTSAGGDAATMEPPDAQLALATLLVRLAMVDRAYLFEEVEAIDRVLAQAFDLNPLDAAKLRANGERCSEALPEDGDLAAIIRDTVDYAHRQDVVTGLWTVAAADGMTVAQEAMIVDLVERGLFVAPADSAAAKAAASIP